MEPQSGINVPPSIGQFSLDDSSMCSHSGYNGMLWKAFHKLRFIESPEDYDIWFRLSGSYQNEIPGSGWGP